MKYILVLTLAISSVGCQNSESEKVRELEKRIDSLTNAIPKESGESNNIGINEISKADSIRGAHIRASREAKQKELPNFKSYQQLRMYLFAVGSTRSDLVRILGNPEFKESSIVVVEGMGHGRCTKEEWYYGEMSIIFHHDFIETIRNGETNPHCLDYYGKVSLDLLRSDVDIEKKWGQYLMDNQLRTDNPYGIGL